MEHMEPEQVTDPPSPDVPVAETGERAPEIELTSDQVKQFLSREVQDEGFKDSLGMAIFALEGLNQYTKWATYNFSFSDDPKTGGIKDYQAKEVADALNTLYQSLDGVKETIERIAKMNLEGESPEAS